MTATAPPEYQPHSDHTDTPSDETMSELRWFEGLPEHFGVVVRSLPLPREVTYFDVQVRQTPERDTGLGTPLRFDLDDAGEVMAWDVLGVALGLGPTPADAAAAWVVEAREVHDDLAAHEAQLHPRLLRQLRFLRFYFG